VVLDVSRIRQEVDAAGLCAYRAVFGLLMAFAVARFWANGWIDSIYLRPDFHFTYLGLDWVHPWSDLGVYVHFGVMFVAAVSLAVGFFPRVSAGVFALLFTYAELWEKAAYLNHYYFVSLVAVLLMVVRTDGYFSVRPNAGARTVPWMSYGIVRFQIAVVYFYAGFAKLNADWLFRGEPLATWLRPHADLFTLGGVVPLVAVALAMSWAGAIFDLTIWAWMSNARTRPWAFVCAVVFHLTVWALFPIGVFSFVMILGLSIFFSASWPRRFVRLPQVEVGGTRPLSPVAWAAVALWCVVQLAVPLRFVAYETPVNWAEEGYRFAWRVMLTEKVGSVEFDVVSDRGTYRVAPRDELTCQQYQQMSIKPDMILEYAHHLAARYRAEGHRDVAVFADSWVAYNGRRSQRYVRDDVDLAAVVRGSSRVAWMMPL
jgi:hypothetical protein